MTLFYEGPNAKGRAEEAQRIVVDTLRSHLPTELRDLVQPLALEIGSDQQALAERTRKRLQGTFVLHGRIASRPEGNWSIYPRLLEPAFDATTHIDWFTHDQTPANPRFGPFVSSLTPQVGVHDEEFPLEFCRDLEALLRGILGRAAVAFGAYKEAVKPLEEALKIAGESTNVQIDALRLALARAMAGQGEIDEAINYLRARVKDKSPSPELLRGFAHLLLDRANGVAAVGGEPDLADRDEQIAALRLAREQVADPLRDQSTYNLFAALDFGGLMRRSIARPTNSWKNSCALGRDTESSGTSVGRLRSGLGTGSRKLGRSRTMRLQRPQAKTRPSGTHEQSGRGRGYS